MQHLPPRILTIAGSDSGGGAGIQADVKTITALGGYAMTAVTAVTAQDTTGVHGVHPVPAEFVALQIDVVVGDIGVDAVKTGMLGGADVVEVVADRMQRHGIERLVVDPVMAAKGGAKLLAPGAESALREKLLPLALVVTPNLSEAAALARIEVRTVDDMREAARCICALGARWALVKGGHLDGDPVDVLSDGREFIELARPRVDTRHTHGTGCTFSAAIATFLGRGDGVPEAVAAARDAVQRAIEHGLPLGKGRGPVGNISR
jgi:hydroxymethylpyrimidine/phosphomethylpyrimidine kinase